MKILQWLATIGLVVAGVVLLVKPVRGQAFVGTRFTVVDAGTVGRPDVVLIPGLTSSRAVWDGEVKLLAPNFRLHLVQVNGFAGQPAGANATGPMLPPLVEELHGYVSSLLVVGHLRPIVVGHSLGGLLAMMLAEKYPLDMRKLVIVDSLPWYGALFGADGSVATIQPRVAAMRDMLEKQIDPATRKAGADMTANMLALDPDGRKVVAQNSVDSDAHVMAEAMYEDAVTDLRGDVAKIKTPTLMLYPFDPAMGDPAKVDALYQGAFKPMPNVTLVRVDGSRHFIMFDQPAKFDEALEAFLKKP
jgi:pimeloyl-ACP methyl ester carboxylesterase